MEGVRATSHPSGMLRDRPHPPAHQFNEMLPISQRKNEFLEFTTCGLLGVHCIVGITYFTLELREKRWPA
jgi:hypothetical protein